jgi:chromosomal replication initiation ATPase DnaA
MAIAKSFDVQVEVARLRTANVWQLIESICAAYKVSPFAVTSRNRRKRVSEARQEIWRILKADGMSYPELGELFNRDHTTIVHGVQQAKERLEREQSHELCVAVCQESPPVID